MWLWLNTMGEMPRQEPPQIPIQGRVQLLIPMGQLRALQLILTRVHKPQHFLMEQRHVLPPIPIQELKQQLILMGQQVEPQLILTQERAQQHSLMELPQEAQQIHILEQGTRHIVGEIAVCLNVQKNETLRPRFPARLEY